MGVGVKAIIEVELIPWIIPNFITVAAHGGDREKTFPLSHFDSLTLDKMCVEFREAIFKKAEKQFPPTAGYPR